jgi:hypothetical protein
MLPAIGAEVSYTADRVSGPEFALRKIALHGRRRGRLPQISLSGWRSDVSETVALPPLPLTQNLVRHPDRAK